MGEKEEGKKEGGSEKEEWEERGKEKSGGEGRERYRERDGVR